MLSNEPKLEKIEFGDVPVKSYLSITSVSIVQSL